MIYAVFKRNSGRIVDVNISGHAESVDEGYDMVCSAVSAISLTIANGVTEVVKVSPYITVKDGFLNMNFEMLAENNIDECQVLLQTMLLGLKSVETNYGDYISVEIEEV
jgi:uncharacterized protein YsxB (DUF464 family)